MTTQLDLNEARTYIQRTVSQTRYDCKPHRRDLDFDIDVDYILELYQRQQGLCALTGWPLEVTRGGSWHGKNPRGLTMDRKNNSGGYTRGNLQLVGALANSTRSDMPLQDFIRMCGSIARYHSYD